MSNDIVINDLFVPFSGSIPKTGYYIEYNLAHNVYVINCTGTEASLIDCPYSLQLGSGSNCYSSEDAAVICQSTLYMAC